MESGYDKLQQQLAIQQRLLDEKQRQIEAQQKQIEELTESVDKLKNRSSQNSSVPPTEDHLKKSSDKSKRKRGKKSVQLSPAGSWRETTAPRPKYDHPGKTRNGFGQPDQVEKLDLENCPICGADVEPVEGAPQKVQQVAELVEQPISIREYRRPLYQCPKCGWSGYPPMPWGVKEGFSYGGRLSSVVSWLVRTGPPFVHLVVCQTNFDG